MQTIVSTTNITSLQNGTIIEVEQTLDRYIKDIKQLHIK